MKESVYDAVRMTEDDRRKFRRYGVSLSVLVQPAAPAETEGGVEGSGSAARSVQRAAMISDISMTGLVFVSSVSYPVGSLIEIQLTLGAIPYTVQALIRRSQVHPLPGRRAYACGAQFVRGEHIARFVPAVAKYLLRRANDAPLQGRDT